MSQRLPNLRYLLFQVRNRDDPMRSQEVDCFARALECDSAQIQVFDLLQGAPTVRQLDAADLVLLGGSGDYSVAEGGPWLPPALGAMRELFEIGKPTFASCWGFQAMAQAMGGETVTDVTRAEVGAIEVRLTQAGKSDSVFGPLGDTFLAQMGHQDHVVQLPRHSDLLASSQRVTNQAYRFQDKPIYCTQFHPELNRTSLLDRVRTYPWYIERILGLTIEQFAERLQETPETDQLLRRFVAHVFG